MRNGLRRDRRVTGGIADGPEMPTYPAEWPPALVELWETKPHSSINPWTRSRAARDTEVYGEVSRRDLPQREG